MAVQDVEQEGGKVETRILLHVEKRNGNSAEKAEHCGGKVEWNDR